MTPWVKRALANSLPASEKTGLIRLVAGEATLTRRRCVSRAARYLANDRRVTQ
jgi:hypothetical protein